MFVVRVDESDLRKTRRRLNKLPRDAQKKALRKAMSETLNPIAQKIRNSAPKKTGALRKAHGRKTFQKQGRRVTMFGVTSKTVTVRGKTKKPIEYATRVHDANPWMKRIWQNDVREGERRFGMVVGNAIEQMARKG